MRFQVTIWIPLEDVPPDHGAVRFASGSQQYILRHKPVLKSFDCPCSWAYWMTDLFPRSRYWDQSEAGNELGASHSRYDALVRQLMLLVQAPGRKAGDASIHSGQTLHSVLPNR